jgi:hypothetical protein
MLFENSCLSGRTDRLTYNLDLLCEQPVADDEAVAGHAFAYILVERLVVEGRSAPMSEHKTTPAVASQIACRSLLLP